MFVVGGPVTAHGYKCISTICIHIVSLASSLFFHLPGVDFRRIVKIYPFFMDILLMLAGTKFHKTKCFQEQVSRQLRASVT